jgi:NDP-sugar pyrophosphorylase family protein
MKVDHVLILAAGKGTRMGEIGKELPKVLWPVFEKSILELEVLYARALGYENIFINLYNYADKIQSKLNENSTFNGVRILLEEDKLDIGGAVHNLAREVGYKGNLLVLNSDQFIMIDHSLWEEAFLKFSNADHLLFAYNVNSNDKYNALVTSNNKLVDIIDKTKIEDNKIVETYTGMSLINLEKLSPCLGESNFFESVANYKKANIIVQNIEKSNYWDFGTLPRYWNSIFSILENIDSNEPFVEFLKSNKGIITKKIKGNSYNSDKDNCINLTKDIQEIENAIILNASKASDIKTGKKIIWNDLVQYF